MCFKPAAGGIFLDLCSQECNFLIEFMDVCRSKSAKILCFQVEIPKFSACGGLPFRASRGALSYLVFAQNFRASRDAISYLVFAQIFRASRDAISYLVFALILKMRCTVTTRDGETANSCSRPKEK